jgi:hypothetical protein
LKAGEARAKGFDARASQAKAAADADGNSSTRYGVQRMSCRVLGAVKSSMRNLVMTLLIAVTLASCAGVEIGPVDHSCHLDPYDSQGSGCEHSPFRGAWRP